MNRPGVWRLDPVRRWGHYTSVAAGVAGAGGPDDLRGHAELRLAVGSDQRGGAEAERGDRGDGAQ